MKPYIPLLLVLTACSGVPPVGIQGVPPDSPSGAPESAPPPSDGGSEPEGGPDAAPLDVGAPDVLPGLDAGGSDAAAEGGSDAPPPPPFDAGGSDAGWCVAPLDCVCGASGLPMACPSCAGNYCDPPNIPNTACEACLGIVLNAGGACYEVASCD